MNGEKFLYLRYCETGIYRGFFKQNLRALMGDFIKENDITKVFPVRIFNDWDINAKIFQRSESKKGHSEENNSQVFSKNTVKKGGCLNKTFPTALKVFQKYYNEFAPGFVIYCNRNARYANGQSDKYYYRLDGIGDKDHWYSFIKDFAINRPERTCLEPNSIHDFFKDKESLSLEIQCDLISALPNIHSWTNDSNSGVKKEHCFIPTGRSPRNMILDVMDKDIHNNFIIKILCYVLDGAYHLKKKPNLQKKPKPKRLSLTKKPRKTLTQAQLLDELDLPEDTFDAPTMMKPSPYLDFKHSLFNDGTILWRENTINRQVVVMNDYDSLTGIFKFNDFAMITRTIRRNSMIHLVCTCDTFRTLSSVVKSSDWDGVKCCHIQAIKDIYSEFKISVKPHEAFATHSYSIPPASVASENALAKRIEKGLQAYSEDVMVLDSVNVEKFSVRSSIGHHFVHVFKSNQDDRVFVACQSGICSKRYRKLVNFCTMDEVALCAHLTVFKSYLDCNWKKHRLLRILRWQNIPDDGTAMDDKDEVEEKEEEEDEVENEFEMELEKELASENSKSSKVTDGFDGESQTWKFHTRFPRNVCTDRFDNQLKENTLNHLELCLKALRDREFVASFHPAPETEVCDCEIPWRRDGQENLLYSPDGMTTLYTKLCTIECQVFKLVCKNSKCIQVWNGSKENIFRLSRNVCIVEELCWEFTNNVCTMKCNFSSFSKSMNDIYISHQSAKKFLTSKTFLKIYFAWASHQNREFRRACHWCGESPKALACDGTKIGIMSRNLRIVPMESVSSDAQKLPTQNRRNDRCFLRYPEKDPNETIKQQEEKEKRIRDARLFLKSQTKRKVLDEKKNADKKKNKKKNELELSPEEIEDQTKLLLGVIPKELVPLFTSYFNQKMSLDQLVATKRVFYFLSFDCALRTFLPSMLLPTIESLLQANIFDDDDIESVYEECRKFNPALEAFLQSFVIDGLLDENAANLLKYICNRIRETEALNPDVSDPLTETIPYNPKDGSFYYFRPDGAKIRNNRHFSIDDGKSTRVHDDKPTTSSCTKKYPTVATRGASYLFFGFALPMDIVMVPILSMDKKEGRMQPAPFLLILKSHLK
ncbi:uncharacterized protein [Clytia hemisphaerica]|uniref:SWIM-type domain-containing protein n=2 Tax=Clytia hemisphaerica TaxID=252671 RepID=A0A7M5X0U9_9CNID